MERHKHDGVGERGCGGDRGGCEVADFADENRVRILAHEGAPDGGEFRVVDGIHPALSHAGELDFDRILDGAKRDAARVISCMAA